MFTFNDVLWSILIPAGIALLVLITARFKPGAWAMPVACGLGILIAVPVIRYEVVRLPVIPPADASDWVFVGAVAFFILSIVDSLTKLPFWVRGILVFVASGASLGLMLKFKFNTWSPAEGAMTLAAGGALAVLWWVAIESVAVEGRGILAMILCWLIGLCVAMVILMLSSKMFGKFSLALAAVSGGACVAILLSQSQIPRRGFAILFCGMLILILGAAKYLSPVSPLLWAILASTPLFVLAGRWIPARLRPWQRGVIRLAIAAIPLFTSLTLAIIEFNHQPQDDSYYYQ